MRQVVGCLLAGVVTAASTSCDRSVASFGTRERAYRANNRGVAELEEFKYPEATTDFREALRIDGSLALAHVNLALALLYQQDEQGAGREASEAERLLPSAPQPLYILGLVAHAENRPADAAREFERVRQIDANDIATNVNLGQIYFEQQEYARAIDVLRSAVAAEPYNITGSYTLGLALIRSGSVAEGNALLQRVQALRGSGYAVTYGSGYLEQGRYAEALVSTGLEPGLIDTSTPRIGFTPTVIASEPASATTSTPFGRSFSQADLTGKGFEQIAASLGGGLTLIDYDGDGDLDVFEASPAGQRLFRNDGEGRWTEVTIGSGLETTPSSAVPVGCVAGDYDNDGRPDLFVFRYGSSSLYHNDGGGHFSDATAAAHLPPYPFLPGAAAFVDVDHDGDLDLLVAGLADPTATRERASDRPLQFPADFAPAPLQLLRNNGNGTFTDATASAGLTATGHAIAIVPTDFDNHRDVDLLVVNRIGPPSLFKNLRDDTFRDVAKDVGLAAVATGGEITAVTAADVNKDDYPDFFFARETGGVLALSDGRGGFAVSPSPDGMKGGFAAQFVDYDNDGVLDLLTWSSDGPHVFRNLGRRWTDATAAAIPRAAGMYMPSSARALALADLDGDGRTDLMSAGGTIALWRNSGTTDHRSERVALKGLVSNRSAIGTKVEIRSGSLSGRLETSSASPAVAPADLIFGLGTRSGPDTVRVLWPSGILQAETELSPPGTLFTIEELNRKPSSCPFLFTWNGERFDFVTDFMGGGEMGYLEHPGEAKSRNKPKPVEYVRINQTQLKPKDGRFEIRVTNELEETLFADRFQLLAIAHPPEVSVYPDEGLTELPKPFRLVAVTDERVPRAFDDNGRDVTDRVAQVDRTYPNGFKLEPFRGFAGQHTLTLELPPVGERPVLLLTGWTDYAFSSDNLAAHQAGLALSDPSVQVHDVGGKWRTIVQDVGIPVGRPQTIPVPLGGLLRPGEHEVRIVTNMRVYWDRIRVGKEAWITPKGEALDARSTRYTVERLDPITAVLRARGFSAVLKPDEGEPERYDYDRVSPDSPWKAMLGRYTREGDVGELLAKTDDKFVIAKPGDEIALAFDATENGSLPDGWTRTFLLMADGFSKEMDINSASPDTVEPLPFHAMSAYPYHAPEHYPDSPDYRHYLETYNTRVVARSIPPVVETR